MEQVVNGSGGQWQGSWADLPWCILEQVLGFLDGSDAISDARLVCSTWYFGQASRVRVLRPVSPSRESTKWLGLARIADTYTALELLDLRGLRDDPLMEDSLAQLEALLRTRSGLQQLLLPRGGLVTYDWLKSIASSGISLLRLSLHGVQDVPPWGMALLGVGLPNLTALDVSHMGSMEDDTLTHLRPLLHLRELDISAASGLLGEGLKHLSSLGLLTLRVADCRATTTPAMLQMLSPSGALAASLTELDLSGGLRLPDETLHALGALSALRRLCIAGRFGWTAQSFGQLARATRLTQLDSSHCRWITDDSLLPLRCLVNLRRVDMSHSLDLTSHGLGALTGWTNIQHLHLVGAIRLSDDSLCQHISQCKSLITLSLAGCPRVSEVGVSSLSGLTGLQTLRLEDCPRVTDSGVAAALCALRRLSHLSLRRCARLGDGAIAAAAHSTGLETLCVAHCAGVTDIGLAAISPLSNLKQLDIRSVGPITDAGIATVCASNVSLVTLQLGWCPGVTDVSLHTIAKLCDCLEVLELYRLVSVTDLGVEFLRHIRPRLRLSMYKCSLVSMRDL